MNAVPKPTQHPLAGPSMTGSEIVVQVLAGAGGSHVYGSRGGLAMGCGVGLGTALMACNGVAKNGRALYHARGFFAGFRALGAVSANRFAVGKSLLII